MSGEKLGIVNIEDSDLKNTGLIQRLCVKNKTIRLYVTDVSDK